MCSTLTIFQPFISHKRFFIGRHMKAITYVYKSFGPLAVFCAPGWKGFLAHSHLGHFRTFFQVDYGDEWWFEFAFGMWRPFSNPAQRSMGPSWITRWENQPQISLTVINSAIHVFHPASNCKWPCPFKLTRLRILLLANMSFLCLHPNLDILWFYLLFNRCLFCTLLVAQFGCLLGLWLVFTRPS